MKPYEKLVRHWRAEGLTIAPGASAESLRAFESKSGMVLSADPDFKQYLLSVDGMAQVGGQDSDQKGFAFWPLSRIKSVPEECAESNVGVAKIGDVQNYFVFADYMQWSWAYAISLSPEQKGKILQFGTHSPQIIADSFSDFVQAYLHDSEQLYLPQTSGKPS